MLLGIAGYRGSGKTTVFNCLTGATATTGFGGAREANRGNIRVPDDRIDKLSAIFKPKKTTYADISFIDLPGPDDKGIDPQGAAELRRMDALVHVARGFEDDGVPARSDKVDVVRDARDFDQELCLLDLMVIENRVDRLRREGNKTREQELLERLAKDLGDDDKPARVLALDEQELTMVSGFQFLSLKPQLVLANLGDDMDNDAASAVEAAIRDAVSARAIDVMGLRGNIELEISQLDPEDQASFLEDLGLTEIARDRFVRACYAMVDLISFFTVGEDEVRAWTIRKGTPAVQAAGKIHSDLERGFIRAETVAYDDFIAAGSMGKAREAGKFRLEGKDYVVKDGDIINVRFNV